MSFSTFGINNSLSRLWENMTMTQTIKRQDIGSTIAYSLRTFNNPNNMGQNHQRLLTMGLGSADANFDYDPFARKEAELKLRNAQNNLAMSHIKHELAIDNGKDEHQIQFLQNSLVPLNAYQEHIQKALEQIGLDRIKEKTGMIEIQEGQELSLQDKARLMRENLNIQQKSATRSAIESVNDRDENYQQQIRALQQELGRLQKEVLHDSVQIAKLLNGQKPTESYDNTKGGDSTTLAKLANIGAEIAFSYNEHNNASTQRPDDIALSSQDDTDQANMTDNLTKDHIQKGVQESEQSTPKEEDVKSSVADSSTNKNPQQAGNVQKIDTIALNKIVLAKADKIKAIASIQVALAELTASMQKADNSVAIQSRLRNQEISDTREMLNQIIYA